MTRFSANLGFLWTDRPLADAIHAAKNANFDAVECHWPYDTPTDVVNSALSASDLPMISINTRPGDVTTGDMGLAAIPGREPEAREAIAEALEYANAISAKAVHVLAGRADGPAARETFIDNLNYASQIAGKFNLSILIESLNRYDNPGYFLKTTDQAKTLIDEIGAPNLKLMFDCYHVGRTEGDLTTRLAELLPLIGHIQFASVPDRGPPDRGEIDFDVIFAAIDRLGWSAPIGAEYKPGADTDETLSWMRKFR